MIAGGYTLHLYCDLAGCQRHGEGRASDANYLPSEFYGQSARKTKKLAREAGWKFLPERKVCCPECSGEEKIMSTLTISTPGLNPSNKNAEFPNLARQQNPPQEVIDEVTAITDAELQAAGINVSPLRFLRQGEVPTQTYGDLSGWSFRRAWYYWIAEGPGIPPEIAERLHATHGTAIRVEGHCGCPSPLEWRKGFAIGDYHVDSPDGLRALADTLRSIYDPDKDSDAQPYMGGKRG